MAKKADIIDGKFSLGGEQAEADPLLDDAFYESGDFQQIESFDTAVSFVVARTGGGKTAALQQLEVRHSDSVIRITPQDLSLPYLTGVPVFRRLEELDVHLNNLFVALWKHVLIVELLRHKYHIDSEVKKQTVLDRLTRRLAGDSGKQAALEYVEEFGSSFWCQADERVREVTKNLENKLAGRVGVRSTAGAEVASGISESERRELTRSFQRAVNETQLPRLNKMLKVLDEDIFDSFAERVYVVIDDLDHDWVDQRLRNILIRCLLQTVLEFARIDNVRVLVALRTDIIEGLDFGKVGGQEEKFRAMTTNMKWRHYDLEQMLSQRFEAASIRAGFSKPLTLRSALPNSNSKRGDPLTFILDRTLYRPRDAIAYLNLALDSSHGKTGISWQVLHDVEAEYSHQRLLALRDEWKIAYPGVGEVLECLHGASRSMTLEELEVHLVRIALLAGNPDFEGVRWISMLTENMNYVMDDWWAQYGPTAGFLYKLGVIGFIDRHGDERLSHRSPHFGKTREMEYSTQAFVDPTYVKALEIQD